MVNSRISTIFLAKVTGLKVFITDELALQSPYINAERSAVAQLVER